MAISLKFLQVSFNSFGGVILLVVTVKNNVTIYHFNAYGNLIMIISIP